MGGNKTATARRLGIARSTMIGIAARSIDHVAVAVADRTGDTSPEDELTG